MIPDRVCNAPNNVVELSLWYLPVFQAIIPGCFYREKPVVLSSLNRGLIIGTSLKMIQSSSSVTSAIRV